jgi:hypothetical protein
MPTFPVLNDNNRSGSAPNPFSIGSVTDLRWAAQDRSAILCVVTFPNHPLGVTEPMPFTAHPNDTEAHGRELFYRALQGDFGAIGEWTPPDADELATAARSKRDAAMSSTQWLVDRHRDEVDDGGKTTLSAGQFETLQAYRRALRNITSQAGFPVSIVWPDEPTF